MKNKLRKLGIYRSGKKTAVYSNAKERPIEFQEQGVFNADKDLIQVKGKLRKDWMLGFLGFLFLLGIPGILTLDWLDMLWLIWIVWFVYFIPRKQ